MEKVLYVFLSHGSPDKENSEGFSVLSQILEQKISSLRAEGIVFKRAFLEFQSPTFDEFLEELQKQGDDVSFERIFVQPALIFRAGHIKDIENKLRGRRNFFLLKYFYGIEGFPNFFADYINSYIDFLRDEKKIDNEFLTRSLFLFVGRGSSDEEATSDFYRFSRLVWEKAGKPGYFEVSFCDANFPGVQDVLSALNLERFSYVFIIPVVLFRGFVLKKIEKSLSEFSANFIVFEPFGNFFASRLADFLVQHFLNHAK